jgi:hypothetical protein
MVILKMLKAKMPRFESFWHCGYVCKLETPAFTRSTNQKIVEPLASFAWIL